MEENIYFKKCKTCNIFQDGSLFTVSQRYKDGIMHECRSCANLGTIQYAKNNPNIIQKCKNNYNIKKLQPKFFVQEKTCLICKQTKYRSGFLRNLANIDALSNGCKYCFKERKLKNIIFLPDDTIITCKECKQDKTIVCFIKNNKFKSGYGKSCKACCNIKKQAVRSAPGFIRKDSLISKTPDARKKRRDIYHTNKHLINKTIEQKLHSVVSVTVRTNMKIAGGFKNHVPVFNNLNYTVEDLKNHLKIYFNLPGNEWMNFNNFGRIQENYNSDDISTWTWQLDHILPSSLLVFDSYNHPNFLKCWAKENLRPLLAINNIKKNNKLLQTFQDIPSQFHLFLNTIKNEITQRS